MTIECRKHHRKEDTYGTEEPPLEQQKILLLHDGFYLESDPAEEDNGLFKRCPANLSGELVWSLQQTGFRRFSLSSIFSAMDGAESADFFHRAVSSVTAAESRAAFGESVEGLDDYFCDCCGGHWRVWIVYDPWCLLAFPG